MIKSKLSIALLMASSLPIGMQANNIIESGDTSRVYDIDEVVVIDQPKEAFRLRQQPLSSTSFNGDLIRSLNVQDVRNLSVFVPSFSMPEYGSRYTSSIYMRGIGSRVYSPAVGIYVDGMPILSKSAFNFHTYDIDRIDVLHGPQGTLYGMNTEGGLIRLYSRNPFQYQGTDVKLSIGTKLHRQIEASHYEKLNDKMAFSVAGFYGGQMDSSVISMMAHMPTLSMSLVVRAVSFGVQQTDLTLTSLLTINILVRMAFHMVRW